MTKTAGLLAVGLALQAVNPTGLPTIERYGVGSIVIGAEAQKIYEVFAGRRELVDLGYEGALSPALLLRFVGVTQRDGVVAELIPGQRGLTVWRIEIRDPAFRTMKASALVPRLVSYGLRIGWIPCTRARGTWSSGLRNCLQASAWTKPAPLVLSCRESGILLWCRIPSRSSLCFSRADG